MIDEKTKNGVSLVPTYCAVVCATLTFWGENRHNGNSCPR